MTDKIRVLHVDDDPDFSELVRLYLKREHDQLEIESILNSVDAQAVLDNQEFDCVVSDYEMPEVTGLDLLKTIRGRGSSIPFILFTGKGSEEVASEAISAGVTDYLRKGGPETYGLLANRIENAVREGRLRQFEEEVKRDPFALLDEFSDPVFTVNSDWEFTYLNQAAAGMFDTARTDLLGQTIWEQFPEGTDTPFYRQYRETIESGETRTIVERSDRWNNWYREYLYPREDGLTVVSREITSKKAREAQIAAEQRKFETLADILPHGIYRADPETFETTYANTACWEIHGFDPDERPVDPERWQDAIHPEDRTRVIEHFEEHREREAGGDLEYRICTTDGNTRWVRDTFDWERDSEGNILALAGVYTDITEEKRRIEEIESQQAELQEAKVVREAMIEAGGIGTWEWDIKEDVITTNPVFAQTFGVDPEEANQGVALDEFIDGVHEDDRERVVEAIEQAVDECGSYEAEYRIWDDEGDLRWVVARGRVDCDDEGNPRRFPGAVIDITDRKERELALQETKQRLDLALEDANAGIWEWNIDTGELYWSDELIDLLGLSQTEYGGAMADFEDRLHPDDHAPTEAAIEETLETGEPYHVQQRVLGANGEYVWLDVRGSLIEESGVRKMVGIGVDISEQKELEDQLTNERNRLEEFTSVASHDLRNPIQLAQGRLEMARDECDSDHLDGVETGLDRAKRIIDDLLWLAREGRDVGEIERVDLRSLVDDAWDIVAAPGGEASITTDERVAHIEADDDRLSQLLENLFRNAIEHGGQDVSVRVEPLPDGFAIEDDGPGIPPEDRERVFEAGFSTSSSGNGFGLRIVQRIASAHGWDVSVTDGEDGGARFELTGVSTVD